MNKANLAKYLFATFVMLGIFLILGLGLWYRFLEDSKVALMVVGAFLTQIEKIVLFFFRRASTKEKEIK